METIDTKLPIYSFIDGDIEKMSLVMEPAVERNFICFSKQRQVHLTFNDEKHIISGVALLADVPIYRYNEEYGEHYVVFTKDLIESLVLKFFKDEKNKSVNIEHDIDVEGITIIESYILNQYNKSEVFNDVPLGSWIVSYKVENPEIYNKIKEGKLCGFSIEGYFTYNDRPVNFDELDEYIAKFI